MLKYKHIEITGPVSVERREQSWLKTCESKCLILLLGPTGTGKSNFIECLAGNKGLRISGDSLESVTQEVAMYQLVNVMSKDYQDQYVQEVFLVDAPGFCDRQLSEVQIVTMIQEWFRKFEGHNLYFSLHGFLFFHRITDRRVGGSLKRTILLLKKLVGTSSPQPWPGVVTTMWDTFSTAEQIRVADEKLQQLMDEHLEDALGQDTIVLKFYNDQKSALKIISDMFDIEARWKARGGRSGVASLAFTTVQSLGMGAFSLPMYEMLVDRISGLMSELKILDEDLAQPDTQQNKELVDELLKQRERVVRVLGEMEETKASFKEPPKPLER
ncbi:hypothetical protein BJ165DRAFT_1535369 [Panaeolus papilionaceus]|nr:hypothetical protein BJ165DRAFT_1535369 [Panaeolus papilionaceus]